MSNVRRLETPPLLGSKVFDDARRDESTEDAATDPLEARPLPLAQTRCMRTLFDTHYAAVFRLLRRLGVPPPEIDDAAQEVFWVATRRLSDIEAQREHAFLYGVALRVASNLLRRQRATPSRTDADALLHLADERPSPEQEMQQRQARELLDVALSRLPLELRTVFVLFELEGMQVRDIAELEEIPLGTASSRLRRAREEFSEISKRIRATLAARGGGPR